MSVIKGEKIVRSKNKDFVAYQLGRFWFLVRTFVHFRVHCLLSRWLGTKIHSEKGFQFLHACFIGSKYRTWVLVSMFQSLEAIFFFQILMFIHVCKQNQNSSQKINMLNTTNVECVSPNGFIRISQIMQWYTDVTKLGIHQTKLCHWA